MNKNGTTGTKSSSNSSKSSNSSVRRGNSSSGWMDDHRCIGRTFKGTTDTYGGLKK